MRIWMINIVLVLLVFFFGLKTYTVWSDGQIPETGTRAVTKTTAVGKQLPPPDSAAPPPSDFYEGIAEKNLFSPDRKEPVSESAEEKKTPARDLSVAGMLLTGTLITDGYRAALVSEGSGSKGKWVQEGERLNGLEVSGIQKDKVLLKEGNRQVELRLYEGKNRKKENRITSAGQQPVVVTSDKGKAEEKAPENGSLAENQEKKKENAPSEAAEGDKKPLSIAKEAAGNKKDENSSPAAEVENEEDAEFEIIQTPFGTFKRKKR